MSSAVPRDSRSLAEQALPLLAQAAQDYQAAAYAVGGFVRDRLLGLATADVDVLVTARLQEVAERVAAQFRAALVTLRGKQTTIRLVFSDRSHLDLALPRTTPSEALAQKAAGEEAAVAADLRRRDFTINALAVPLAALSDNDWPRRVIDPTCGRHDLERRVVRATGAEVFCDDPLRLLRALRLAAHLGFDLDAVTAAAIRDHAPLIGGAAAERVRDELFGLLGRPDAAEWLRRAADLGLLFQIVPELAALRDLRQGGYHHLDAWEHTLAVVAQLEPLAREAPGMSEAHRERIRALYQRPLGRARLRLALLQLAGLLHDIAKPATAMTDDQGAIHFYGHDKMGAAMARQVGRRLRLSRKETQYVETTVAAHMRPALLAREDEISRRAAHRFFARAAEYAPDVLILAWADRLSARGPAVKLADVRRVESVIRSLLGEWLDRGPLSHPVPPVGARAIMRRYNLRPGPEVGRALRILTRRHAAQPFADARQAWAFLDRVLPRRPTAQSASSKDNDQDPQPFSRAQRD